MWEKYFVYFIGEIMQIRGEMSGVVRHRVLFLGVGSLVAIDLPLKKRTTGDQQDSPRENQLAGGAAGRRRPSINKQPQQRSAQEQHRSPRQHSSPLNLAAPVIV